MKLVHFREDFILDTFVLEETDKTLADMMVESGASTITEAAKKTKILVKPVIEAIHAGVTKNYTFYAMDKLKGDPALKSGTYSWTTPYPKPMLTHHNSMDGEPIGRIFEASFETKTVSGRPAIVVRPSIVDPDAAQKVRDGRYLTVSIGAHTDSVTCSICGYDVLNEGWCPDHNRGQKYDGETCMWNLGNLWFDELSYVDVPADQDAMNVSIEYDSETSAKEAHDMPEDKIDDKTEVTIIESVQDPVVVIDEGTLNANSTIIVDDINIAETLKTLMAEVAALKVQPKVETEPDPRIAELEAEVAALKEDKQQLITKVAEFEKKAHADLVDRVIDLKIALNKLSVEDKPNVIDEYIARSSQSLQDYYNDLLGEAKVCGETAKLETKVTNPGLGAVPGEANSTINGVAKVSEKPLDIASGIKKLFSGSKN